MGGGKGRKKYYVNVKTEQTLSILYGQGTSTVEV